MAALLSVLGAPLPALDADEVEKKAAKSSLPGAPNQGPAVWTRAISGLPNDAALPVLAALRAAELERAIKALDLAGCPVELALRGYTPRSRATFEVRVGRHRFAVKAYANDPGREAALYKALGAAGLAGVSGPRVPRLLARNRNLHVLVISWPEGPTAQQLVERGKGERAGELAARWLRRAASLPVTLGPSFGAARMLHRGRKWAAALAAADPTLGIAATELIGTLARNQPKENAPRLVHGTLYARHVLDLGDDPGVIDWQRFGQGPLELDAGMFLATVWRLGLLHQPLAIEAARAEAAFLAETTDLTDARTLAWHRAAALLRLAEKRTSRRQGNWLGHAQALLAEAGRLTRDSAHNRPGCTTTMYRKASWNCRIGYHRPERGRDLKTDKAA